MLPNQDPQPQLDDADPEGNSFRNRRGSCAATFLVVVRITSTRRLFFGDVFVRERQLAWIVEADYGSPNGDGVSSSSPWDTGSPSMISRARVASAAATTTLYWEDSRAGIPR